MIRRIRKEDWGQRNSSDYITLSWNYTDQTVRAKMLRIDNLTKRFGGVIAVDKLSLRVDKGVISGLIGPNGAGKTTLVDLVTGIVKPDAGEIYFKNKKITGLKPHVIAQRGIVRTFQISNLFNKMTTFENLFVPRLWRPEKLSHVKEEAAKMLEVVELSHMKDELAGNLSGGQQRLLEAARALMADPELLLLDEPFYGIHPSLKNKIVNVLRTMNKEFDMTFIIVSHDVPTIMGLCENVVVMNSGKVISEGAPEVVRNAPAVIEAYLGV